MASDDPVQPTEAAWKRVSAAVRRVESMPIQATAKRASKTASDETSPRRWVKIDGASSIPGFATRWVYTGLEQSPNFDGTFSDKLSNNQLTIRIDNIYNTCESNNPQSGTGLQGNSVSMPTVGGSGMLLQRIRGFPVLPFDEYRDDVAQTTVAFVTYENAIDGICQ